MKNTVGFLSAAVVALGASVAAHANTLYDNAININLNGDCSFSTTCAATFGRGDEYAAQKFTLTSAEVVTSASFSEYDVGTTPTDANWGFLLADGTGGLPGTILASGTDTISSSTSLGSISGYNVTQNFFSVGSVLLGPGTYYFALQAISPTIYTYLGQGFDTTGAAETNNGGVTWAAGYENSGNGVQLGGVAVALYGADVGGGGVPEPATWTLMLLGVGGVGAAMRRRSAKAAVAA